MTTTDEPVAMDVPVEPHYHHSVSVGLAGEKPNHLVHESPLDDPFATTVVDITTKELFGYWWSSLRRKKHLRIQTSVGGDWDAVKHVMTVRPLRAMLPPDQAAQRVVDSAFAEEPDELSKRRTRDEPHTVWYWVNDPHDPIRAPYAKTLDTADEAEAWAQKLIADEISACAKAGIDWPADSKLEWVKVFRADNENYETFRWPERP